MIETLIIIILIPFALTAGLFTVAALVGIVKGIFRRKE